MQFIKVCVLIALYILSTSYSYASLLISPQRLFFEPRERVKEMVLLNNSSEEVTYRIEWVELMQTETGGYEPILESTRNSPVKKASEHIRFSPRQVKLRPGENQKVKFVVRKGPNMSAGEYRSHIKFVALPRPSQVKNQAGETAFDIQVLTSFVVPIILREGNGSASFDIRSAVVKPDEQNAEQYGNLEIEWSRVGAFGAVGNLSAMFKPKGASEFSPLGVLNGVNFFAERDTLRSNIVVTDAPKSKEGTLKVTFTDTYTNAGVTLAEKEFEVVLP